jgi:hypothetical protein
MMSIMICSSLRHVPLVNAVQYSASEQGTSFLDPGYDMTKPRSFLGHRGSQDVLVEVLHSVALQRRRLRLQRTRLL